jgi:hypothetical protein
MAFISILGANLAFADDLSMQKAYVAGMNQAIKDNSTSKVPAEVCRSMKYTGADLAFCPAGYQYHKPKIH